jgi:hypothetical protein
VGDLFTLAYDGSACTAHGQLVSTVVFCYHMFGATMGTLRLVDAFGQTVWSESGNKGSLWGHVSGAAVNSVSFAFDYVQ